MPQDDSCTPYAARVGSIESVNALFRKVYQYMTLGLVLTSITAWLIASSQSMLRMFESSLAPLIIVAIVEIGFVFYISSKIFSVSITLAFRNLQHTQRHNMFGVSSVFH